MEKNLPTVSSQTWVDAISKTKRKSEMGIGIKGKELHRGCPLTQSFSVDAANRTPHCVGGGQKNGDLITVQF